MERTVRSDQSSSTKVTVGFAAIVLAMLPAVLDQTILASALPTIAGDLGRLTDVSWLVTAYVVAAAATTPLWGKLGDRHGRKRLIEIALVTMIVATLLGTLLAFGLVRARQWYSGTTNVLMLIPLVTPEIVARDHENVRSGVRAPVCRRVCHRTVILDAMWGRPR